jgi:hypothetical protein
VIELSLRNAKIYKSGILIDEKNKKTLIVPFQVFLTKEYDRNLKFQDSLNRQFYHLLIPSTKRFTIFFDRLNDVPIIYFYTYFSAPTLQGLHKIAKSTLQRIKNYLKSLNLEIKILDTEIIHKSILKKSEIQTIIDKKSNIFQIVTKNETIYLTSAILSFPPEQEVSDITDLLRDFYAILKSGRVCLDVSYDETQKDVLKQNKIGINITIDNSVFENIVTNQKKLQSLLSIFSNQVEDTEARSYWFADRNELMKNYGKIILGQGWKFFPIEANFLNFAAYFNLLIDLL